MKNKNILISLLLMFIIGIMIFSGIHLVSAETEVQPVNKNITLTFTCTLNNAIPSNLTEMNITVNYPNGSSLINNQEANALGNGAFSYNTNFPELGLYNLKIFCWDGTYSFSNSNNYYDITQNGTRPDSAGGLIYIVVIVISFISFLACLIWCFNTQIKYLKLGLGLFSYILFNWILFILWQLSYNYLNIGGLTSILRLFFIITGIGMFPAFILSFLIILKEIKDDIWEKKMLSRGIFPEGSNG